MAFVKKPCKHCPFRSDVTPFLTQERAEELAYSTQNPYNYFACHKTTESDEEGQRMLITNESLECAGFITMQLNNSSRRCPDGFKPSWDIVYAEPWDMIATYEEFYNEQNEKE